MSTRSKTESYTAYRTLHEFCAPDGGAFAPFHLPRFTKDQIRQLSTHSVCENIASVLNLFFSSKLSSWDVEFCIGRYPIKLTELPHKLIVAEVWHNLSGQYSQLERSLYKKLCGEQANESLPHWVSISVQCALLFAIYGASSVAPRTEVLDISVDDHAFLSPMAAWYARKMGLPIGTLICGGYNGADVWNLIRLGEIHSNVDPAMAPGLERFIYTVLGRQEATRFSAAINSAEDYAVNAEILPDLGRDMFAAVVSVDRIVTMISNFFRSTEYILDSNAAVSLAALQDYRSSTGSNRKTLILSMENPADKSGKYLDLLGFSPEETDKAFTNRKG